MNPQRLLRILILTDVFSVIAVVTAATLFEGTLPEPLRNYAATEELHPLLLVAGLILLVLLIVGWVGLWRGASWAPAVYALMWAGSVVIQPFGGAQIATGIEEMFGSVGTAAGGGILALLILARGERRNAERAALDTTSEALHDAGRPDRPDEPVPAHLKSWRAHQLLSWLYGFIALMMLALPYLAWTGEERLRSADLAFVFAVPLFFFALAGFHHFVSRGAKERNRWARIGSVILACILLPGVPVGTIIGLYLLRNSSWERRSAVAPGG